MIEFLKYKSSVILLSSIFAISLILYSWCEASGFRLTEQSLNGTALNSAYISVAYGAFYIL